MHVLVYFGNGENSRGQTKADLGCVLNTPLLSWGRRGGQTELDKDLGCPLLGVKCRQDVTST